MQEETLEKSMDTYERAEIYHKHNFGLHIRIKFGSWVRYFASALAWDI